MSVIKPNSNFMDMTGRVCGRLTVLGLVKYMGRDSTWRCRCECGKFCTANGHRLKNGQKKSCGCLQSIKNITHGYTFRDSPPPLEYGPWCSMRKRCLNPKNEWYHRYGGRGITVCQRWLGKNGFANFLADMGTRPSILHSLGRKNNDGNYNKKNCRWETPEEQQNNTRQCVFIGHKGKILTAAQWSRICGVSATTIRSRYHRGLRGGALFEVTRRTAGGMEG